MNCSLSVAFWPWCSPKGFADSYCRQWAATPSGSLILRSMKPCFEGTNSSISKGPKSSFLNMENVQSWTSLSGWWLVLGFLVGNAARFRPKLPAGQELVHLARVDEVVTGVFSLPWIRGSVLSFCRGELRSVSAGRGTRFSSSLNSGWNTQYCKMHCQHIWYFKVNVAFP